MAIPLLNKHNLDSEFPRKNKELNNRYYQGIRPLFKTGDILFFSGDHWLSNLIRWRSKSAWSHMGFVICIEEIDRIFLVESIIETGVRMVPLSMVFNNYSGDHKAYNGRVAWTRNSLISENKEVQTKIKEFCLDNLTKQYDKAEYVRIIWRSIVGSRNFFYDDKYTCSEFAEEAFKAAKVKLPKERGYFISPGAFYQQKELDLKGIIN